MSIDEELDDYLMDFGDQVTADDGRIAGWGIVSQPDVSVLSGMARVPKYVLLARTDLFGHLDHPARIEVLSGRCAGEWVVTGPAEQIGDGAFCNVYFGKAWS